MYVAPNQPGKYPNLPNSHSLLPLMVSRLALSLKKSADPRSVAEWRVDHFTRVELADVGRVNFAMRPVGKPTVGTGVSKTLC